MNEETKRLLELAAKDWHQWAERHGYIHTGYLNGKPRLVKAWGRA